MRFLIVLVVFFMAVPVEARVSFQQGQNCSMVETATLGVNFSNVPIELDGAKGYIEQKSQEIMTLAEDVGVTDLSIQNMNYNIYSYNNGGCGAAAAAPSTYQLNGNVSFQLPSADKAPEFMKALSEKGYNVNFNLNAYRQCQ